MAAQPPLPWVELLVCPRCRGELSERPEGLLCIECRRLYPIVEGIPWMDEALSRRFEPGPIR